MRKILLAIYALFVSFSFASAQSTVAEIEWYDYTYIYYHGLLVLNSNNRGAFYVNFQHPDLGEVVVCQNALLNNEYDMYGNCTSYLYCSYPKTYPYTPYMADNFIFYPNGNVYTQDYSGSWSVAVQYRIIPRNSWDDMFEEFGLE